jgi:hypothetical protein
MRVKYESILQEYEKQYQVQLERQQAQRSETGIDKAEWYTQQLKFLTSLRDRRVRKFKISFAKWKFDYQTQIQEKYENLFHSMQEKYLKDYESIAIQNSMLKEKESLDAVVMREKDMILKEQENLR